MALNTQIKVGADSSGVATGLEPGKRALKDLGGAASDTGKALGGIGNGTAQSAQKVESATKSMIQSIQRTTAATEAGDKSTRAYQESLARIRGVDVAALKPYLDQLDAVKSKQLTAASAAKSYENSFSGIQSAALAAGAALAGFGLAVGKLVSVQREFDILNSSLITVTGSSAAAAREMQWIKDFAKETPFGLAQATQGFVKMKALGLDPTRASLTSFGNTASAMGKDLNQMIEAVADASTGEFERLKEFGIKAKKEGDNVSLTFQGITTTIGSSASEITQYLEKLGNVEFAGAMAERAKTLDGAISELGDTWDELFRTINTNNTGSLIYDSITLATAAIGDATTIINAMTGAASANTKETGAMAAIQSGIATVFETVAFVGANLKFVLVGIGNEIGGLAAQVGQAAQFNFAGVRAIREQMVADAKSARAEIDATTARILGARDAAKELASYNTRNAGAQADPRRLDTATAADAATKAVKATTAAIKENTDARRIQDERIRLSRALNTADGKAVEDANDAYKKMMDDLVKANDKYIESLNKSADAVAENVLKLSDEETALRISTEQNISLAQAIEGITIKRLEEKRVMELIGNNDAAAQAIAREIEQRKLLANAIDSKDARESVKKSAADAAAEWKRTSDQINSTLTDALMRGFESGKGFAKTLRDTVVNMFKTMVLRPIISAIMSPVSAAIGGALGLSGAASAATGVAGGAATGLAGTLAGFAATAASWGTAAGAGFMATLGGSTIAGGGAAGILATGGAAGASTAGSIGAAAPYALAAVAALAAFGAFRTTKKVGEGITGTLGGDNQSLNSFEEMRKSGYLFGGPKYWDELKTLDATMAKAINTDFDAIKTAAKGAASALGLSADSVAGFSKAIRLTFTGDKTKDEAIYKEYMSGVSDDLARTIIGSYKETVTTAIDEITSGPGSGPWWDGDQITNKVERQVKTSTYTPSEFARDGETASQTLARLAQSITLVNANSDLLGNKLTEVGLKGAATASMLIDAFGGAERYAAQMGAYYQNFYTQEEQRAKLIENTSEAFTALGKTMPVLDGGARAAYRSMVELAAGQDMSVESNRAAYASLLSLQGAMNELAPAFVDAEAAAAALAESSKAAAEALAKTNQGWQDQLDVLTGAQTDRSIALRDAADDSTRAIMRQVYAQQDLKTASEAAAIALQGMIDAANSSKTSLADKYKNPLTLQSASAMLPAGVAEGLLGMNPTDVRTAIGGYISGLDPLTEAGRAAITQLAGLAPALDVLVAQVDSVAAAAAQAAANLPTFADGVNAAMSALKSSVDAQKTLVTDAYTAQSDSVRAALDTVTGSVGKLKSLSDSLKGTLDGLRVAGSDGEYRAAAQAQISAALAVARNSGTLPLDGQLTSALATVSKPSEALYGTFTDYARDFYKTANDIAALSDITGTQLTAEEVTQKILTNQLAALKAGFDAQIKALNSLADTAQAQVDAALGINSSVLSVTDALNNLAAVLGVDSIASSAATSGSALGISKAQTRNGVAFAGTEAWRIGDLSYDSIGNAYMAYGPTGSNPGVYTSAQLEEMNHWAKGVINTWADTKNLPHFATGTNYVTADGPAYLHEGEAVVPRAYNPAAGGSNDTASALRAMADRLDRIEANTRATAGHTAGTDRKLARVIPGNALITEAVV